MKKDEISKLVTYIEENLRASRSAGLSFVDSRVFRNRLLSKQNHVVFGRRGAGKTSLVNSIRDSNDHIDVYLNLEDYKDITFPNIIIHVLWKLFELLDKRIRSEIRFWRCRPRVLSVHRRICRIIKELTTEFRYLT